MGGSDLDEEGRGGCSSVIILKLFRLAFPQETLRQNLAEGLFGKSQPVLVVMTVGFPAVANNVNGGDSMERSRKRQGRSGSVM